MVNTSASVALWRSVRALPEFWRLLELRTVSQFMLPLIVVIGGVMVWWKRR